MPKIATDYSTREVSFYKFVCNDPEIKSSYVGSTVDFTKRKNYHKEYYNNPNSKEHHRKIYQTIRENGGWSEWRMIEIEKRLVKDKREAQRIEQEWIEKLQANMNMTKAHSGCETKVEYNKQYRIENADAIKEYIKQYYIENADDITEYHKQYRLKNADDIKEKMKKRWLKNADKRKEVISCECGSQLTKCHLQRHLKTQKHIDFINSKQST